MRQIFWMIFVCLTAAFLSHCAEDDGLAFETIRYYEQHSDYLGKLWGDDDPNNDSPNFTPPKLRIITTSAEAEELPEAAFLIREVDFEIHFVIFVYRGTRGSSHYDFEVRRVIREGMTVNIFAHPGVIGTEEAVTYSYHLIKLPLAGWPAQRYTFRLLFAPPLPRDPAVASQDHHVPYATPISISSSSCQRDGIRLVAK